jgi:hypothetical protein
MASLINPILTEVYGWLFADIDMIKTEQFEALDIRVYESVVLCEHPHWVPYRMFTVPIILLQASCYTVLVFTQLSTKRTNSHYVQDSLMLAMMYL